MSSFGLCKTGFVPSGAKEKENGTNRTKGTYAPSFRLGHRVDAACSESPPSIRLGHRKTSDSTRAVNGAQSRPEHGVITITIMIMMRKHPYNLPTPATDFQLPTSTTRQIGGRIFLERDDKDAGCIPLDLYPILYLNLCALPVRDEDKDAGKDKEERSARVHPRCG